MYKLDIVYEDKNILVVNKESGLLTVSNSYTNINTLYHYVYEYLHKKNQKVFIVHRLDKDTSGLIMFAKNEKVKFILQNNWNETKRYYLAIVIGIAKKNDVLRNYLSENKYLKTIEDKNGKLAITKYKLLKKDNKYSLLDIEILTGKKNQIRFQLNNANLPILGDNKYGNNKYKKMCLHAYKLVFNHPITHKEISLEIKKPNYFIL